MKKILMLFMLVSLLYACGSTKKIKYDKVTRREFIITDIDGGRNFRVDLKDVRSGTRYRNVEVAKKCDSWKEYRVGDKIKLKISFFNVDGKELYDFTDIKKVMCH